MGGSLVIQPDGDLTGVKLKPGGDHLRLMCEHLNCSAVSVVPLTTVLHMWVGRGGSPYRQPVNLVATALARHHGHFSRACFGPVMICGPGPGGGRADLDGAQMRALLTRIEDLVGS